MIKTLIIIAGYRIAYNSNSTSNYFVEWTYKRNTTFEYSVQKLVDYLNKNNCSEDQARQIIGLIIGFMQY